MTDAARPLRAEFEPGAHVPWDECAMVTGTDEPRDRPDGRVPPCPLGITSATTAMAAIAVAKSGANARG
jgi:hypothetical protein